MAKKHKHEEHVNHERWLVSFADMMTLLFALFVVLYSLGQANQSKMKEVKSSIQWAFNITGEGKTNDIGIVDKMSGAGDVAAEAPLVTAQDGEMREFLKEAVPEYEEVAGKSLTINQTDDTVTLTAPLSDFFEFNKPFPIKSDVMRWLNRTVTGSLTFASSIDVQIESPELPIGVDKDNKKVTSLDLCILRLKSLERVIRGNPEIRDGMVSCQWRVMKEKPGGRTGDWESRATVRIAFSNTRPENR